MKVATIYLKSGQSFQIEHENLTIKTIENGSKLVSYEVTGMPMSERLFWLDIRDVSAILIQDK